jgi:hypothetical protein
MSVVKARKGEALPRLLAGVLRMNSSTETVMVVFHFEYLANRTSTEHHRPPPFSLVKITSN